MAFLFRYQSISSKNHLLTLWVPCRLVARRTMWRRTTAWMMATASWYRWFRKGLYKGLCVRCWIGRKHGNYSRVAMIHTVGEMSWLLIPLLNVTRGQISLKVICHTQLHTGCGDIIIARLDQYGSRPEMRYVRQTAKNNGLSMANMNGVNDKRVYEPNLGFFVKEKLQALIHSLCWLYHQVFKKCNYTRQTNHTLPKSGRRWQKRHWLDRDWTRDEHIYSNCTYFFIQVLYFRMIMLYICWLHKNSSKYVNQDQKKTKNFKLFMGIARVPKNDVCRCFLVVVGLVVVGR